MYKWWIAVVFLLACCVSSEAQTAPRMRLDSLRFIEPDGNTRLEFPLGIFRSRLHYRNDSAGNRFTSYRLRLRVYRDTTLLAEELWDRIHRPAPTGTGSGVIPELASASLPQGKFRIEIELTDSAGHFRERKTFDPVIVNPVEKRFQLSSLLVSSNIEQEPGNDEFHRNGYLVIPFAEKLFGQANRVVYFYWEQYFHDNDTLLTYSLELNGPDQNSSKPLLHTKILKGERSYCVEAIPIKNLPTGSYIASLRAMTLPSNRRDSAFTRFFIYRDSTVATSRRSDTTFVDDALIPFADIHYLIPKDVADVVAKLNPEEQRIWAINFWRERDPTPGTPYNEKMEEYRQRLLYVDRFTVRDKPGWQTDRGRIYLQFGTPDEMDDHTFESSLFSEIPYDDTGANRPYVIWRYHNLSGGTEFVFGDLHLFGEFELLHSTYPGEKHDPYWNNRLRGIK